MKTMMMGAAVALVLAFSAGAQASESADTLQSLASQSGLTVREVQMVLGAHTAYAEYRTSYDRAEAKLVRAIGQDRLDEIAANYRAGKLGKNS